MPKKMHQRFYPSGLNSEFKWEGTPFPEYIEIIRDIIARTRTDLTSENRDKIIDANCPYEWFPENKDGTDPSKYKKGILLVHGLYDSPYTLRGIGKYLNKMGFLVRSVLLPGHGTVPGDLLNTHYHEWLEAVNYGLDSFKDEVENLFIMGFSLGGLLSLDTALKTPNLKGTVLFSPAIKIKNKLAPLANIHNFVSWKFERAKWLTLTGDVDYTKYESFTFNSVYQTYLLTQDLAKLKKKKKLKMPLFILDSRDDIIVDTESTLQYFMSQTNPKSKMVIYSTDQEDFPDARVEWHNSVYPDQNIISFSHICTPISPDDPHYGKNADYKILFNPPTHGKKNKVYWGEKSRKNLRTYQLGRTSYNPDFNSVMLMLHNFLNSCMD